MAGKNHQFQRVQQRDIDAIYTRVYAPNYQARLIEALTPYLKQMDRKKMGSLCNEILMAMDSLRLSLIGRLLLDREIEPSQESHSRIIKSGATHIRRLRTWIEAVYLPQWRDGSPEHRADIADHCDQVLSHLEALERWTHEYDAERPKRGRRRDYGTWRLIWDLAVALDRAGLPVTKYEDGVLHRLLVAIDPPRRRRRTRTRALDLPEVNLMQQVRAIVTFLNRVKTDHPHARLLHGSESHRDMHKKGLIVVHSERPPVNAYLMPVIHNGAIPLRPRRG